VFWLLLWKKIVCSIPTRAHLAVVYRGGLYFAIAYVIWGGRWSTAITATGVPLFIALLQYKENTTLERILIEFCVLKNINKWIFSINETLI
jgi:hypothetical protein